MFLELEKVYITKLKTVLQSNWLFVLLFVVLILFLFVRINFCDEKSLFDINNNHFILEVRDYKLSDEYIKLTLCSDECIIGNYYFKNVNEVKNIKYGSKVEVKGNLVLPSNNTVPKSFSYKEYLNNKNIYYLININTITVLSNDVNFIYDIKNFIDDRISSFDKNGYVRAFILGVNDYIDDDVYERYTFIGVTHLFALSGMHISFIVVVLNKLFKKLGKYKYLVIDVILIIYGLVLYFPASLKRTICFYVLNSFFKIFNIKISTIKVLLLSLCFLIFVDYKIIYDIGFIYSFIIVGGIIYSNELLQSDSKIKASFKLAIIVFLFSLPISLYYFYSINVLSILYNVFYIFFVSNLVYPISLIVFFIPKLYFLFEYLILFLEWLTSILRYVDFAVIWMDFNLFEFIIWYLILILYIKFRKTFLLILLLMVLLIDYLIPYFDSHSYVYYFDLGKGDSSLIIAPNRSDVIMIDTGGVRGRSVLDPVISYFKSLGIKKIDSLVLTHGDYDHMGEAINLVKNIDVGKVIFNCGEFNELENTLIKVLDKKKIPYYSCSKELNIDNNKLCFLNNKDYGNENDNSNVIYTELNNHKFLFMGDAGVEVEEDLTEKYNLKDIDILKVGHHGSKTSSSKNFIDEIEPKYSIISVGKNNRYGHPNKEVLNILKDSKVYRTDQDGSVMFKIKSNKLEIGICEP